jgi:hypothetical protein
MMRLSEYEMAQHDSKRCCQRSCGGAENNRPVVISAINLEPGRLDALFAVVAVCNSSDIK